MPTVNEAILLFLLSLLVSNHICMTNEYLRVLGNFRYKVSKRDEDVERSINDGYPVQAKAQLAIMPTPLEADWGGLYIVSTIVAALGTAVVCAVQAAVVWVYLHVGIYVH